MRLTEHSGVPRPTTMTLQTDPLIVWLSKTVELEIHRGDRLGLVAKKLMHYWELPKSEARRIVAFWYAIGERQHRKKHTGDFTKVELLASKDRRYLVK